MKSEKLINPHEVKGIPTFHNLKELLKASLQVQKISIKDDRIVDWKYFEEFQIELINVQVAVARALRIIDPWCPVWRDGELSANNLISKLQKDDKWKQ